MRTHWIALFLCLFACLLASCKKGHYDIGHVHGVDADGEVLLPLASGSYSLESLLHRFQIDSIIEFDALGDMTYDYSYEQCGAVKGSDLLQFKDWSYQEHFVIENNSQNGALPFDTIITLSQVITFEADHIRVMSAMIKSGLFNMSMTSNVGSFGAVLVTTSDIKDANGNDLSFTYQPQMGMTSFNFEGMRYQTYESNTLHLDYEFHLVVPVLHVPVVEIDVNVSTTDLAFREMHGYVDPYASRNSFDTVFSLFPDNVSGNLEVKNAQITVSERNTFGMAAHLTVDTALVWGVSVSPYDLFAPMPLGIDIPPSPEFIEVHSQPVSGWVDAHHGHILASSLFSVNSNGMNDLVTVTDSCNIDVKVDVSIPFSFNVDKMSYVDTVDMKLDEIELPEMIEELAIEIEFNSTLPLELRGRFMLFDSETGQVTDVLLDDATMIAASYYGQVSTSKVGIAITEDRLQNALRSDRIILCFDLDTDAHDVSLNAKQGLDFFAKARVKYNGIVEFESR